MTTTITVAPRVELGMAAAEAALALLPTGGALEVGTPVFTVPQDLPAGQAVCARFSGATQGEVAVVVGQDLVDALRQSPLGELDLAKAVQPALEAAARKLGPVVLEPALATEPEVGLGALANRGEPVFVPLLEDGAVRAVLALVATPWPAPAAARSTGNAKARFDLLHDVEMSVTAELGRTRMTVRELLSLAPGAVVELDRAAGSPVDLLVNGRLVARGEVVVIDENFGIRVTEILSPGGERQ
ncbi:flagellar motor switch protein FliN [Planomonospora sp. ID91781]|uniref:flagellar motor switch protein FliN n=1 Tax=Planomonospora sp. ID91781 TaxID=2738135 RepID=UPI0018C3D0DC|nr:flagellar motor switch protein FliN [Planomonospora sp. ID91781]MBG0826067.1 flagellar motor switch protein FliN [Planomonospora sp. ID91781]